MDIPADNVCGGNGQAVVTLAEDERVIDISATSSDSSPCHNAASNGREPANAECLQYEASCSSERSSKSSSPDPDFTDIKPNADNSSYNIMSVCSSAAQHIRQTITEVLNSRVDANSSSVTIEEISDSLEESLKQKLEDFENTVKNNMSSHGDGPKSEKNTVKVREVSPVAVESNISCSQESKSDSSSRDTIKVSIESEEKQKPCQNEKQSTDNLENPAVDANITRSESKGTCDSGNNSTFVCNGITDQSSADNLVIATENHITDERSSKKSNRNSTNKKRGEKTVDQILKSLSSLTTTDEKLQTLCRKHAELLDELKSADLKSKQSDKQVFQLIKEKEQLQGEHNRMILTKSKLESLCRELQRQNKAVKEESLLRIREEEEKRKEVASKFQTTLNEISNLMQENSKKNLQLKEENTELAQKLKTLVEHYEMWEKHMEKVVQQKDLEAQLAKAKHAKTNLQLKQETEKFLKEKQSLLENMSELQKKCTQLASNELQLRAELNDYTSKYEEFQSVLNKSNQVFASFKMDMETTSKKIKKLEKETNIWKQKWESSNNALLEMITDKQKRDKELLNSQQRVLTLEKLCRALQAERNDLQNQLNGQHNIVDNESGVTIVSEIQEAS